MICADWYEQRKITHSSKYGFGHFLYFFCHCHCIFSPWYRSKSNFFRGRTHKFQFNLSWCNLHLIVIIIYNVSDLQCRSFPGPGQGHSAGGQAVNPMKEFIHPVDDSHVSKAHNDFKRRFKTTYKSKQEHDAKKDVFKHNLRYKLTLKPFSVFC